MKAYFTAMTSFMKGDGGVVMVALLTILSMSLLPQLANAQSIPIAAFDSPLPGGDGAHPHPAERNELHELLDEIIDRDTLLADVLGITVEELAAARDSGTHLDQLIEDLGLDAESVRQNLESARDAAIEQAVTDGLITDEQAALILNAPHPPAADDRHGRAPHGNGPDKAHGPREERRVAD